MQEMLPKNIDKGEGLKEQNMTVKRNVEEANSIGVIDCLSHDIRKWRHEVDIDLDACYPPALKKNLKNSY